MHFFLLLSIILQFDIGMAINMMENPIKQFDIFEKNEIEKINKLLNFFDSLEDKKFKNVYKILKRKFKKKFSQLVTALFAIYLESDLIRWESAKRKILELDSRFSYYFPMGIFSIFKKEKKEEQVAEENLIDMYINIGRDKKVFPPDLLKFICNNSGVKQYQIHDIRIFDSYSFFKIPKALQDKIIISLSGKVFRGKNIIVNLGKKQN